MQVIVGVLLFQRECSCFFTVLGDVEYVLVIKLGVGHLYSYGKVDGGHTGRDGSGSSPDIVKFDLIEGL